MQDNADCLPSNPPSNRARRLLCAENLSLFQLYGTPLITAVSAGGLIAMLGIVVVGFGSASVTLERCDIAG